MDEDPQESYFTTCWTTTVANTPLLLVAGNGGLIKVVKQNLKGGHFVLEGLFLTGQVHSDPIITSCFILLHPCGAVTGD